jgi:hypothetical protein
MLQQACDSFDDGEGYALSVFAGVPRRGLSDEELITEVANVGAIPNRMFAVTTAAALRIKGFQLVADHALPAHVNVLLGTLVTLSVIDRFAEAFQPARENPIWPVWRKR